LGLGKNVPRELRHTEKLDSPRRWSVPGKYKVILLPLTPKVSSTRIQALLIDLEPDLLANRIPTVAASRTKSGVREQRASAVVPAGRPNAREVVVPMRGDVGAGGDVGVKRDRCGRAIVVAAHVCGCGVENGPVGPALLDAGRVGCWEGVVIRVVEDVPEVSKLLVWIEIKALGREGLKVRFLPIVLNAVDVVETDTAMS
jgi:hypothetical protein